MITIIIFVCAIGLFDALLHSFDEHKDELAATLAGCNNTLISLVAVLHSENIIDAPTKSKIIRLEGKKGASMLLDILREFCKHDITHTEMILLYMSEEDKLKKIVDKIYENEKDSIKG